MTGMIDSFLGGFQIRKPMPMGQWAYDYRRADEDETPRPGPWRTEPFQQFMIECLQDPLRERFIFMTSAQIGKTATLLCASGYYTHWEPSKQLMVLPDQDAAKAFKAERWDIMAESSPEIAKCLKGKNKADFLQFKGGFVAFVGAHSPTGLSSRPVRVVLCDEIDRYPMAAKKEGDPVNLAMKRTKQYRNRKIILSSTPGEKSTSRIWRFWQNSTQHFWYVSCPQCDHEFHITWKNVLYDKGKPETASCACLECGYGMDDHERIRAVKNGRAIAHVPDAKDIGFNINAIYTVDKLSTMVRSWLEAEGSPEEEQTFVNTELGWVWEGDVSQRADVETLKSRKYTTPHGGTFPAGACGLVRAVDVQIDRLEIMDCAVGPGNELWVMKVRKVYGDPSGQEVWDRATEIIDGAYVHPNNDEYQITPDAVIVDSGYQTQTVYEYCSAAQIAGKPYFAIKGVDGTGKVIWAASKNVRYGEAHQKLFLVGTDDAKSTAYARFNSKRMNGPKTIHFHEAIDQNGNEDIFEQICSEVCEISYDKKNKPVREWVLKKGQKRNEGLDLICYSLAGLSAVNIDFQTRFTRINEVKRETRSAADIAKMFQ